VDEVFDLSRSVHDSRWLYIRNFMPHLSWMPPERYSDGSTFRRELKRMAAAGQLNAAQMTYAAPRRATEELYDTQSDPHQLENLAGRAEYQDQLERMRGELNRWIVEIRDAGLLTEPQVWERIGSDTTPRELARDEARYPLEQLLDAAALVGQEGVSSQQVKLLGHADDGVRYWAAVGLHAAAAAAELTDPMVQAVQNALQTETSPTVRIELAVALAADEASEEPLDVLRQYLRHDRPDVVLHAARTVELLGERARPLLPTMRETLERANTTPQRGDMPMFIRFSLEAALEELGPPIP
jgi:uncharacterized sulfatase